MNIDNPMIKSCHNKESNFSAAFHLTSNFSENHLLFYNRGFFFGGTPLRTPLLFLGTPRGLLGTPDCQFLGTPTLD